MIETLLAQKKSAVLEQWSKLILETYPENSTDFLKTEKDRFANPVGHAIAAAIEALFDDLVGEEDLAAASSLLDDVVKIRAVQDFSPSEAIAFVALLKKVVREQLGGEIESRNLWRESLAFESKIDALTFHAFDTYVKCREKLATLKADEVKRNTYRLLQRANLIVGTPEEDELPSAPSNRMATQGGNGK